MAFENYYTRFSTTVGGGGYTAASGLLNVAATAGTAANFRVLIVDQTTGAFKALLRVTGVNSGTQYAVDTPSDGTDANCASGDLVYAIISANAMDAIRADTNQSGAIASLPSTTGQKSGNRYKCTDSPFEYVFNGSAWDAYVFGYKVTEPVLANFTQVNVNHSTFDSTHGGILWTVPSQSSSQSEQVIVQAIPGSGAYYIDVAFIPLVQSGNGGVGISIHGGNATSSAFKTWAWGWENSVLNQGQLKYYTAVTTFSANSGAVTIALNSPLLWMRIFDDRTTNRTYYISLDGYSWLQVAQESRTANFTPAYGGFTVTPFNVNVNLHLVHFSIHA